MATTLQIAELLGYTRDLQLSVPISPHRMAIIDKAIVGLDAVENALLAVVTDGMTEGVGDIKLNYGKHTAMLRAEGSRLLTAISYASETPIRFNKYITQRSIAFRSSL